MTANLEQIQGGRSGARSLPVWDPLVRILHWSLALFVLLNAAVLDDDGRAHEIVGYAALACVLLRLVWGVIGPPPARFSAFPPNPVAALRHLRELRRADRPLHLSHNPLGAIMAYNLWLTILALSITGIMMGSVRFFGVEWVEELHEAAFAWLMLSVALHVAGVMLETRLTGVPLLRAMIDGRKRLPRGRTMS